MTPVLLLVLIGGLFVALVLAVYRLLPTPRSRTRTERFLTGELSRDDERCWFGGGFLYYNPNDPTPLVPNRYFVGWTVNLGHPLGKLMLVIILGLLLLPLMLAIILPGLPSSGCHSFGCIPSP